MTKQLNSKKVLVYVVPILSVNPALLSGAFQEEQREHIWRTCYEYASSYIDGCISSDQLDPSIEASNMVLGFQNTHGIVDALDQTPDLLFIEFEDPFLDQPSTFIVEHIRHYALIDIWF